jgi:hypothetical protein
MSQALFISSLVSKGEMLYFPLYLHKAIEALFDQLDTKKNEILTSESFTDRVPYIHQRKQHLWQTILKNGIDFDGDGSVNISK